MKINCSKTNFYKKCVVAMFSKINSQLSLVLARDINFRVESKFVKFLTFFPLQWLLWLAEAVRSACLPCRKLLWYHKNSFSQNLEEEVTDLQSIYKLTLKLSHRPTWSRGNLLGSLQLPDVRRYRPTHSWTLTSSLPQRWLNS